MKILTKFLVVIFVIAVFMPVQILACACCAERGFYSSHTSELEDYLLNEVEKMGFENTTLYTDAGFPETIEGIDPLHENFTIKGRLKGKAWTLELEDDSGNKGSITLSRPKTVEQFMVDQTPLSKSNTVILYKELRLRQNVESATGIFKTGLSPDTEYELVLQGKGNGCTNASDFSTYILQVKGNTTRYSFFGKLRIEEDKALQLRGDDRGIKVAN